MNNEQKELRIGFGLMCPSIFKQIKDQGYKCDAKKCKHFDTLRESLTYIMFADLLPDSQLKKAHQKLVNKITTHVRQANKETLTLKPKK